MKSGNFLTLSHQFQMDKTQCLGKGSTGEVYLGNSFVFNQPVAIKIIRLQTIDNQVAQYLLQMEKSALQTLIHQNVLRTFRIIQNATNCYIITEYCNGGTLKELINKQGSLSESKSLEIMRGILKGYSSLVKNRILHRDLKPANIMFHNQTPKIIDFGYCQIHGYPKPSFQYNVGSPSYMAPESFENSLYNQKTQIWSLGIILYQCLMGKTFDGGKHMSEVFKIIKKQGIPFRKQISVNCRQIISWCLDFNPQRRPTALQLLQHLSSNENQFCILKKRSVKMNSLFEISNAEHSTQVRETVFESEKNVQNSSFIIKNKANLKHSKSNQFGILAKKELMTKKIEDFQNKNQIKTPNAKANAAQSQFSLTNHSVFKTQKQFTGQIVHNRPNLHCVSSFSSALTTSRDNSKQVYQRVKYGGNDERNPESQKERRNIKPSMFSPCMKKGINARLEGSSGWGMIVQQDVKMIKRDNGRYNKKETVQKQRNDQFQREGNKYGTDDGSWPVYGYTSVYLNQQNPLSSVFQLNEYLKEAKRPISIFEQDFQMEMRFSKER